MIIKDENVNLTEAMLAFVSENDDNKQRVEKYEHDEFDHLWLDIGGQH